MAINGSEWAALELDEPRVAIIAALLADNPPAAWGRISREVLTPADAFEIHAGLFDACFGAGALQNSAAAAWTPDAETIRRANITAAAGELGLAGFGGLYEFSTRRREEFWRYVVRRLAIRFHKQPRTMIEGEPGAWRYLAGARMNIVESCFLAGDETAAILESTAAGIRTTTVGELRQLTARAANGLRARGIGPGDAVAIVAPMSARAVAAYLGVIAAGAAVVSIADSFAPEEIATRLRIAGVKMVVTQDVAPWGIKRLELYEKVKAATKLPAVVIRGGDEDAALRVGDLEFEAFLSADDRFNAAECDAGAAVNILFSSGTTGDPKAIPWDHSTPIKAAMDAHFHHDVHPGDVLCWPTSMGWMMGPWLIFASLLNRATMALHLQAPHDRAFGEFVRDAKVTMLGSVPSLVRHWRQSSCMKGLDWSAIRAFSSSGECSSAIDTLYLMHLAGYRPMIEYCGGTEIGGAYVTSTVVHGSVPAAFSSPALGIEMMVPEAGGEALCPAGEAKTLQSSVSGEVFLAGPSLGLSTRLVNGDHRAVYFAETPQSGAGALLRRHGDEIEVLGSGYFRVIGRADDTMNLGGIKVGCAEIERVLNGLPGVLETAAVAVPPAEGGPSRLVIFAVARVGVELRVEEMLPAMQAAIRAHLNPLFHVAEVRVVGALPRTASNKVLRRELRGMLKRA